MCARLKKQSDMTVKAPGHEPAFQLCIEHI